MELSQSKAGTQEFVQVSHVGVRVQGFFLDHPRMLSQDTNMEQDGKWSSRTQTGTHMVSWQVQGEDLATDPSRWAL